MSAAGPQVAVVGEALIDLIRQPNGDLKPFLGGSPYNVALALARQGASVGYVSPLSSDTFGSELRQALVDEGVWLPVAPSSARPTSLAVVTIEGQGQPSYALYRDGVADRDVSADELLARIPATVKVLHTGSLALVPGEIDKMRTLLTSLRERGVVIAVDVNMRPMVERDLDAYVRGVLEILPLCDLVKASDEDLATLGLGDDPHAAAEAIHAQLDDVLVALTLGSEGAQLQNAGGTIARPAFPVDNVMDTVGSGDCFQAALLAALQHANLLEGRRFATCPTAALEGPLDHACAAAAINATRAGAQPPMWSETERMLKGGIR
ncbi:MAG: hypothetical protein KTR31_14765 [Myxococcales bacterium]|nr:hypothetical protein [Myxococcales bacterium]